MVDRSRSTIVFVCWALLTVSVHAILLTPDNWDAETAGKTLFIKFFSPYCGRCKELKPEWDQLINAYKDSEDFVVGEVDCTTHGHQLCHRFAIRAFPSIRYGNIADMGASYDGERDFASLQNFVTTTLRPLCGPQRLEYCSPEELAHMAEYQHMSISKIEEAIAEVEKSFKAQKISHAVEIEEKERSFEVVKKSYEDELKVMRMVKSFRKA